LERRFTGKGDDSINASIDLQGRIMKKRGWLVLLICAGSVLANTPKQELLNSRADPFIQAANGKTALDYAIELGNEEAEELLR
jgi:ankyrin repeat protein